MARGKVILLNGTSSSGKSSLARALQQVLDEPFHHANADAIKNMCSGIPDPSKGGAFARWAYLPKLYAAVPPCFAALAASGNNLIIDDVIKPLQLKNYVESLAGFMVLFVGVLCPEEELDRRERERGDRRVGQAKEQLRAGLVHALGIYLVGRIGIRRLTRLKARRPWEESLRFTQKPARGALFP